MFSKSFVITVTLGLAAGSATAQTVTVTYQGQLKQNGSPIADGPHNLTFHLYSQETFGTPITNCPQVSTLSASFTDGLVTVPLTFDVSCFDGDRWLEIQVEGFPPLAPRQKLTVAPYAASSAGLKLPTGAESGKVLTCTGPSGTAAWGSLTLNSLSDDLQNSLELLSTTRRVSSVGTVASNGGLDPVVVSGSNAFALSSGGATLKVFDISNGAAPVLVGSVATGSQPKSMAVAGSHAYVVNSGANSLQVFDVANPAAPALVGTTATAAGPRAIKAVGTHAYVVAGNISSGTLQVFDVSNPASPALAGSTPTNQNPTDIAVAGNFAYVVSQTHLQAFNIANPATPMLTDSKDTTFDARVLAVSGGYAYIGCGSSVLLVYNLTNPAIPTYVGYADSFSQARSIAVAGTYLYKGNDSYFDVFDVSSPSNPVQIQSFNLTPTAESIAVSGSFAYAANADGMGILSINQPRFGTGMAVAGSVGIGTDTPKARLHVFDGPSDPTSTLPFSAAPGLIVENDADCYIKLLAPGNSTSGILFSRGFISPPASITYTDTTGLSLKTENSERMVVTPVGNVGIGINSPAAKLDVAGTARMTGLQLPIAGAAANRVLGCLDGTGNTGWVNAGQLGQWTTSGNNISYTGGNVGIGTANPTAKLHVCGAIRAVGNITAFGSITASVGGPVGECPDFVFDKDYALMPLEALRAYLACQKHLPHMPSGAEMQRDGVDLGATEMSLLQSTEELTLYMLDQQSALKVEQSTIEQQQCEISTLRAENDKLQSDTAELRARLDRLEAALLCGPTP